MATRGDAWNEQAVPITSARRDDEAPAAMEDLRKQIMRAEHDDFGERVVRTALDNHTDITIIENPASIASRLIRAAAVLGIWAGTAGGTVVAGALLIRTGEGPLVTLGLGVVSAGLIIAIGCFRPAWQGCVLIWRGTQGRFLAHADGEGLALGADVETYGMYPQVTKEMRWDEVLVLLRYRLVGRDQAARDRDPAPSQRDYLMVVLRNGDRLRVPATDPAERWKCLMAIARVHGDVAVRGLGWPMYEFRDTDPFTAPLPYGSGLRRLPAAGAGSPRRTA